MSRRQLTLGSLVAALLLATIGCPDSTGTGDLRREGVIHGTVRMVDLSTGREHSLDRGCKIEIVTASRRFRATTKEAGTYVVRVPETGRWPLNLYYKDRVLSTEISTSPYGTSEVDLFVDYLGDSYALRAVWVDPRPNRRR